MDIEEALDNFDRASVNLAKLEAVWRRARPLLPSGPSRGRDPDYENLERVWKNLLPGLPRIEGWTVEDTLPDMDEIGQTFIDYLDVDIYPASIYEAMDKPGRDIAEYRFRLERARRKLVAGRLEELVLSVSRDLIKTTRGLKRESSEQISTAETETIVNAIGEINRLMGDAYPREGPWNDLLRHLRFGEAIDWFDIAHRDWPGVRVDIENATQTTDDPVPVPVFELVSQQNVGVSDISLNISSEVVRRALIDAEALMRSTGPANAVDRVHTAFLAYLRTACDGQEIKYVEQDSAVVLLKKLRRLHPGLSDLGPRPDDVERILNSIGTISDAMLPIRNQASGAHANLNLLDDTEALLVISATRALLEYLDAKLTTPTAT